LPGGGGGGNFLDQLILAILFTFFKIVLHTTSAIIANNGFVTMNPQLNFDKSVYKFKKTLILY